MKKVLLILLAVFIIATLAGGLGYTIYYVFFAPNNTVVPAFTKGELNLVIEGNVIESRFKPLMEENVILLPLNTVRKYIDPYIYWDEKLRKVTVTTKDRVIRMQTDSLNALVNGKPIALDIPAELKNGTLYIPIEFLSDFYGIKIEYIRETNVIIIDFKNNREKTAEITDPKAVARKGISIRNPIIRKFDKLAAGKSTTVLVYDENEKWYKVRTPQGEIGYMEKKYIASVKVARTAVTPQSTDSPIAWKPQQGRINLVWDQIWTSKRVDLKAMPDMTGLDVISPTWFQLAGADGKLINRADPKYVEWAHNKGYKVWALLNNDFGNVEMSSKFLSNTDARDNLIKELLAYSALYKLDGINIDFEGLGSAEREDLTQFVREVAPFLKAQGMTVSVDINNQACYDRKALGEAVDYIALMAYDQHWSGGNEAGSVAEFPWSESMLNKYLESIPAEKILFGIPFYTRVWKQETDTSGKTSLTSQAVSMETARKLVSENNSLVKWDEGSGQFYSEFAKEGITYKVWLEDANSINLRLSLVHKYGLAGAAGWSRNFAEPEIWGTLEKSLKKTTTYQSWLTDNSGKQYNYLKIKP